MATEKKLLLIDKAKLGTKRRKTIQSAANAIENNAISIASIADDPGYPNPIPAIKRLVRVINDQLLVIYSTTLIR